MGVKVDGQFGYSEGDVVTVDAAGKGLVLQLLLHPGDLDVLHFAARLYVAARRDEAGQFVAGEQRALEFRDAVDAGESGVRQNGSADLVADAALFEDRLALHRMIRQIGMDLPVEVMQ